MRIKRLELTSHLFKLVDLSTGEEVERWLEADDREGWIRRGERNDKGVYLYDSEGNELIEEIRGLDLEFRLRAYIAFQFFMLISHYRDPYDLLLQARFNAARVREMREEADSNSNKTN